MLNVVKYFYFDESDACMRSTLGGSFYIFTRRGLFFISTNQTPAYEVH